jgi:hypothetical protein
VFSWQEVKKVMFFDPEDGLYIFEVIIGYRVNGKTEYTPSCLIQADDPDEAEEKVLAYLNNLEIDQDFWIEEISAPYDIEGYSQEVEENDQEIFPILDELTEEEFQDFLK